MVAVSEKRKGWWTPPQRASERCVSRAPAPHALDLAPAHSPSRAAAHPGSQEGISDAEGHTARGVSSRSRETFGCSQSDCIDVNFRGRNGRVALKCCCGGERASENAGHVAGVQLPTAKITGSQSSPLLPQTPRNDEEHKRDSNEKRRTLAGGRVRRLSPMCLQRQGANRKGADTSWTPPGRQVPGEEGAERRRAWHTVCA